MCVFFRSQAVVIGQTLLNSGWLEPVPQTRFAQEFLDEYALYQPGPVSKAVNLWSNEFEILTTGFQ